MKTYTTFSPRGVRRACLALLLFTGGCQTATVRDQLARTVEAANAAIGLGGAIVFDSDGGLIDAPGQHDEILTLDECVRQTLRAHPGVQAALTRVRIAQAGSNQARLFPNPIVTLVLRVPERGRSPIIEAGLSAELLSLLQRPGRIEAADARVRAASAAALSEVTDVLADVLERYYAIQSSHALLPILETRRDLMGRLQEVARTRLRGGEGSRLDVVTLDAQRAGLESEIDDALLALKEQKLTLNRLMGRPSAGIDWRVSGWDPPRGVSVRESDWIATALERRSELQERVWELKALDAEVRLARFSPFAGASAGVASERDQGWSVGPEVTGPLPLFDWGQARREAVAAQRLEARHRLTQVQREVVEQVRRAALEFDQSVRQLQRVRRELIPLQEQRRELAEAAFRAGQTDVTTLVLAEQDLAAARARAVELERRNSTAMVRLERAVGGPGVAASLVRSATATTSPSDPVPPATAPATPPTR